MNSPLLNIEEKVLDLLNKKNNSILLENGWGSIEKELISIMLDFPETPNDFNLIFKKPKLYDNIILLSGGMDSTIMWELNKNRSNTKGLFLDYGQEYKDKELQSLNNQNIDYIIEKYNIPVFWKHIAPTRNFLLLSLAERYIKHEGEIWIGAVDGESSPIKGDKSDLFFELVTKYIWRTLRKKIYIKTLKNKTKNEWLEWYIKKTQKLDILDTITCFKNTKNNKGCGKCQACVRKWIAIQYYNLKNNKNINYNKYFNKNPYIYGKQYIEKYKKVLKNSLETNNFNHYSKKRCEQDLYVILNYEKEK